MSQGAVQIGMLKIMQDTLSVKSKYHKTATKFHCGAYHYFLNLTGSCGKVWALRQNIKYMDMKPTPLCGLHHRM